MMNSSDVDSLRTYTPPLRPEDGTPAPEKDAKPTGKRKQAGRFHVLNGFVDASMAECTRAEIAVWITLYRDARNGTARISHEWIARRAGITRRSVSTAIRRLERRGLLRIVHQGGLQKGPSRYELRGGETMTHGRSWLRQHCRNFASLTVEAHFPYSIRGATALPRYAGAAHHPDRMKQAAAQQGP